MYLRFVLLSRNVATGRRDGIFKTAYQLSRARETPGYLAEALSEMLRWFESNLRTQDRFNRSGSKGFSDRETKGISWLKADASMHVSRTRELCALLEEAGFETEMIRTGRPGYIVYEDEQQIVAEAFNDAVA